MARTSQGSSFAPVFGGSGKEPPDRQLKPLPGGHYVDADDMRQRAYRSIGVRPRDASCPHCWEDRDVAHRRDWRNCRTLCPTCPDTQQHLHRLCPHLVRLMRSPSWWRSHMEMDTPDLPPSATQSRDFSHTSRARVEARRDRSRSPRRDDNRRADRARSPSRIPHSALDNAFDDGPAVSRRRKRGRRKRKTLTAHSKTVDENTTMTKSPPPTKAPAPAPAPAANPQTAELMQCLQALEQRHQEEKARMSSNLNDYASLINLQMGYILQAMPNAPPLQIPEYLRHIVAEQERVLAELNTSSTGTTAPPPSSTRLDMLVAGIDSDGGRVDHAGPSMLHQSRFASGVQPFMPSAEAFAGFDRHRGNAQSQPGPENTQPPRQETPRPLPASNGHRGRDKRHTVSDAYAGCGDSSGRPVAGGERSCRYQTRRPWP